MKTKKILRKLEILFDAEAKKIEKKKGKIKYLLGKLKKEKRNLQRKLKRENNPEKGELIRQKLKIVKDQRLKGLRLLKDLKSGK